MWENTKLYEDDLEALANNEKIPWNDLKNKNILITGATGLIGYTLVNSLVYVNEKRNLNTKIFILVRNIEKAKVRFENMNESRGVHFVEGEVENLPTINARIDYIIHGASPTASAYFIENPVETIKTSVIGTMNMLELAKQQKIKGFVYLSSMEIYGAPRTEDKLDEADVGYMNPLLLRNCYPEGKRQCENMCVAYHEEYAVPAKCVRLAQTFGPGVDRNDVRVFAEFARCAIEEKDIVLLTKGESKRCYLYTMDAVSAILFVLLKGENGLSYNAGNEETYCSIYEMADYVKNNIANGKIKVKISENSESCKKFPPPHFYNLDTAKLQMLGWSATKGMTRMYEKMIEVM